MHLCKVVYSDATYLINQSRMRSGLSLVSPQVLTGERDSSSPSELAWCKGEFSAEDEIDIFVVFCFFNFEGSQPYVQEAGYRLLQVL